MAHIWHASRRRRPREALLKARQLVMDDIDKRIVSRAQDERAAMEEELRQEIMTTAKEMAVSVAKETALVTLKTAPNATAYRNAAAAQSVTARQEVQQVIPQGVVAQVQQKIRRRLSIIGDSTRPMSIAEAAAAVGAIRAIPTNPKIPTPKTPPSSVRIEIADEAATEAAAIEAQVKDIYSEKE